MLKYIIICRIFIDKSVDNKNVWQAFSNKKDIRGVSYDNDK